MTNAEVQLQTAEVEKDPAKDERMRLANVLMTNTEDMLLEYKVLLRHTGSYLSASMLYAYKKGLNDALKLLLKQQ